VVRLFARTLADGEAVDLDGLVLRLRVNRRARRVSLRIDARTGEAVATAPNARRLTDAVAFARARRDWLAERLEARAQAPRLEIGRQIRVLGDVWTLVPDGRRPRLSHATLTGCGDGEIDVQLVIRAVRRAALERFQDRVAHYCARLQVPTPTLSLIDPRSRWGSCTPPAPGGRGSIRLSWRLALAPFATADYVVAHECAHLIEANHGPRFWALVNALVGDPAPHRACLRREGPALHAFGRAA